MSLLLAKHSVFSDPVTVCFPEQTQFHCFLADLSIGILENLRRLSVDDLEDDGSGMFSDRYSSLSEASVSEYRVLTPPLIEDWENSVASSDQADSLAEDEIKEMDI